VLPTGGKNGSIAARGLTTEHGLIAGNDLGAKHSPGAERLVASAVKCMSVMVVRSGVKGSARAGVTQARNMGYHRKMATASQRSRSE
jgi:hypothetical protein